jgi:hypothetical protein
MDRPAAVVAAAQPEAEMLRCRACPTKTRVPRSSPRCSSSSGLKLEQKKGQVDILTVDKIEKTPTEKLENRVGGEVSLAPRCSAGIARNN